MTKVSILSGRHGKQFLKYFQTFHLLMSGITMGLTLVLVGPTLLDLADVFGVSISEINYVSSGHDLGLFFGSLLAMILFKYISAQKILIFIVATMGIMNILVPHAANPIVAAGVTFYIGISVGVAEIGAYVWIMGLWFDNIAPLTQMLHLAYGIGAFMSPLIAEPYLRHHEDDPGELIFNSTEVNNTEFLNEFLDGAFDNSSYVDSVPSLAADSQVYIPYALIGCFALFNATLMLVSYCLDPTDVKPEKPAAEEQVRVPTSKAYQWILVSLVGFYIMVEIVIEVMIARFLSAYAVQHFKVDRSIGAYLVSLFYIGFTSGRVVAVPLSLRFKPMRIMTVAQIVVMTSAACLVISDTNHNILWICTFTLGFSLAPLFGCSTAWLSTQVTLSHDFMSIVMTIATFGAVGPPFVVGRFIETHPYVLMYYVLLGSCCLVVTSLILNGAEAVHRRSYRRCPVTANEELHKISDS